MTQKQFMLVRHAESQANTMWYSLNVDRDVMECMADEHIYKNYTMNKALWDCDLSARGEM